MAAMPNELGSFGEPRRGGIATSTPIPHRDGRREMPDARGQVRISKCCHPERSEGSALGNGVTHKQILRRCAPRDDSGRPLTSRISMLKPRCWSRPATSRSFRRPFPSSCCCSYSVPFRTLPDEPFTTTHTRAPITSSANRSISSSCGLHCSNSKSTPALANPATRSTT
jgi:hypothetical protein